MAASLLLRIFATLLAFTANSTLVAGEYFYKAYEYPTFAEQNCRAEAQAIAGRLAEEMQVNVLGAICEYDRYTNETTVVIRYESSEPLKLVSTNGPRLYTVPKGFHADQEKCEAALPAEVARFEEQTALPAFLSYCTTTDHAPRPAWYAHIDGFGSAVRRPERLAFHSGRPYIPTAPQLTEEIKQRLTEYDMTFANIAWRRTGIDRSTVVMYYLPANFERRTFRAEEIAKLPGARYCSSVRERITEILSASERVEHLVSFCASDYAKPKIFNLAIVSSPHSKPKTITSPETFFGISECEAARPALEAEYRKVYGEKILGSFCGLERYVNSGTDNQVRVFLLRTR